MDKDCLRTGDKATVHFRFIKTPEYLHIDQRLVFREGRTKAVGTITKVSWDNLTCPTVLQFATVQQLWAPQAPLGKPGMVFACPGFVPRLVLSFGGCRERKWDSIWGTRVACYLWVLRFAGTVPEAFPQPGRSIWSKCWVLKCHDA